MIFLSLRSRGIAKSRRLIGRVTATTGKGDKEGENGVSLP